MSSQLPNIKSNFSDWYNEVIMQADLVDNSPTKGCFVIKPYGYALWELMQKNVDAKIKNTGAQNCYFPLLIPEEFLHREAKHVEGFAPEVAVVTHAGGEKLDRPYVVRPTSETIIYHMFAKWIKSWRDLPLKVNQWANVIRWEKRTRAFLRTTEFLWQEGHTAHATKEDAQKTALEMLEIYRSFAVDYLAIPVITGEKPESERFAGADATYTFEAMMQDGKALQMGTSHMLARSFSAAFDVKFQNAQGEMESPYCTSWGSTTRLIGALVMVHGDEKGLVMPPRIAPIQIVIIPIYKDESQKEAVLGVVNKLAQDLKQANIRVHIDLDEHKTPGAKFFHWEIKGVPLRAEIGPKDVQNNQAVMAQRLITPDTKKQFIPLNDLVATISKKLDQIHADMYEKAVQNRKTQWYTGEKISVFGKQLDENNGFYQTGWCRAANCEAQIKEFKGTIRCIIPEKKLTTCFGCDAASVSDILIAKAY